MNVGQIVTTVVGALIAYIIASTLITQLITGTSAGDTLIQNVVPKKNIGPSGGNLSRITSQIRGKLSSLWNIANPEPSPLWEGVETRRFAPFGVVG